MENQYNIVPALLKLRANYLEMMELEKITGKSVVYTKDDGTIFDSREDLKRRLIELDNRIMSANDSCATPTHVMVELEKDMIKKNNTFKDIHARLLSGGNIH